MVCSRCSLSMAEICSFWEFKELLVLLLYRERLPVRPPCRTVARAKKRTATTTYRRGGERPPPPPPLWWWRTKTGTHHLRTRRPPRLLAQPQTIGGAGFDVPAAPVF